MEWEPRDWEPIKKGRCRACGMAIFISDDALASQMMNECPIALRGGRPLAPKDGSPHEGAPEPGEALLMRDAL